MRHTAIATLLTTSILALAGIAATGAFAGKGLKTERTTTTIGPNPDVATASAQCQRKHRAISGGWSSTLDATDPDTSAIVPLESRRDGKRRWQNSAVNLGGAGPYTTYAYCAKRKLRTRIKDVTAPATTTTGTSTHVAATAKCKRGQRAVSGGFAGPSPDISAPETALIVIGASHRVGKRKWRAAGVNLGNVAGTLTAQVNCARQSKRVTQRKTTASFGTAGGVREPKAKCRRNDRVLSGGFKFDDLDDFNTIAPFLGTFRRQGKRKWIAEAAGGTISGTATLTLIAYCERKP